MSLKAAVKSKVIVSETAIEVDATNVQSVAAKGTVDLSKGTFSIAVRLTTKAISGDKEQRAKVFKQVSEELEKVSVACIEELRSAGKDPNQPELFEEE